ncbi:MAG TPA: hypothetical protein VFZ34_24710 [Blastocatellia bacterium]|nr:hypothetical protein [Blastocatellia bacterium]
MCIWQEVAEKKMIPTKAQRKNTLARWQTVLAVIVILLLCAPPGEAAIICYCPPNAAAHQACHQPSQSAAKERHQASENAASHCQTPQASVTDAQVRESSHHVMKCCEEAAPGAWQNAELSPVATVAAEAQHPLSTHDPRHNLFAPPCLKHHPRQPQRPLYLTFSCWLI